LSPCNEKNLNLWSIGCTTTLWDMRILADHVDIFEVENLTKFISEETVTLGLVLYSGFGLERFFSNTMHFPMENCHIDRA
jgi:hypothetical protein